jgi:hypothetical protein
MANPVSAWTSDEINKINKADELEIQSLSRDGTLRSPVTIWVIRVGGDLYVRAVKGRTGLWFRGTQTRHAGRIQSGGVTKEVIFVEEHDDALLDQIDTAYREKYHRQPEEYVAACLTPAAREATIRLLPR